MKALHAEGIEVLMEVYFPEGTQERLIFDCLKHWVRELSAFIRAARSFTEADW